MVTSHGQESMVLQALKAGARGYVMKPVDADNLAKHLGNALKGAAS
jgi:two-component system chemotaxis response regulator CheY